jgi:hypothetical protein
MREQAGFLKDHAQRALVRRHKMPALLVLPNGVADSAVAAGEAFKAGQRAQASGFAGAGMAEERRDAVTGQIQFNVQLEVVTVNAKNGKNF